MMYPFMTLDDGTEIVHSETLPDGQVKVYLEKPDVKDCFHHATCYLSGHDWQDIFGFSEAEMERYRDEIERTAHIILRLANAKEDSRVPQVFEAPGQPAAFRRNSAQKAPGALRSGKRASFDRRPVSGQRSAKDKKG